MPGFRGYTWLSAAHRAGRTHCRKGKGADSKQLARELSVRYVVEGSLRTTGSRLQVNAQLIDAESGAHIWADRFETDNNDMAAVEGEITGRLLWDLRRNLFVAASRRAAQDSRACKVLFTGLQDDGFVEWLILPLVIFAEMNTKHLGFAFQLHS